MKLSNHYSHTIWNFFFNFWGIVLSIISSLVMFQVYIDIFMFRWAYVMKRPWCWERLKAGNEGDDRGWDGWMASLAQWTCVWVNSRSWWWTGRPGVLQSMSSERVRHDWAMNWTDVHIHRYIIASFCNLIILVNF